ncbi:MAG: 2OG-Fe dioxygenase family protein [Bacteroidia bacterium]
MQLPITQNTISAQLGRTIHSPILIDSIERFDGLVAERFLEFFGPMAQDFQWDYYDVRRLQMEILTAAFPNDPTLRSRFRDYYSGQQEVGILQDWISKLSQEDQNAFAAIQAWRRRAVAQFLVEKTSKEIEIWREMVPHFQQDTNDKDIRSLPRIFAECEHKYTENEMFQSLLKGVFSLVEQTRPDLQKIKITAHFMSVKAVPKKAGNNSPEGAHEDGADYIVSALVLNRKNIIGGETQIIEQLNNGEKEIICRHTLQPGEFTFQADSRDEITYGTDLWHHVTPFRLKNETISEGWRDIIGFDINVIA